MVWYLTNTMPVHPPNGPPRPHAIYLLGSTKGGVGKSTLAVNLATWLQYAGKVVLLIDADVQAHTARWAERRVASGLPTIPVQRMTGKRVYDARRYAKDAVIVMDVGGRDAGELRAALEFADVCIVPVLTGSWFDYEGAKATSELIDFARMKGNDGLRAHAVLNKARAQYPAEATMTIEALRAGVPSLPILHRFIHQRAPFARNLETGQSVLENSDRANAKAREELVAFAEEVTA